MADCEQEPSNEHLALLRAIEKSGSQTKFAAICGCTQGAIWQMVRDQRSLSAEYVLKVERATEVSRHELRPDIYPIDSNLNKGAPRVPPASNSMAAAANGFLNFRINDCHISSGPDHVLAHAYALTLLLVNAFQDAALIVRNEHLLTEESAVDSLRDDIKAEALRGLGDLIGLAAFLMEDR